MTNDYLQHKLRWKKCNNSVVSDAMRLYRSLNDGKKKMNISQLNQLLTDREYTADGRDNCTKSKFNSRWSEVCVFVCFFFKYTGTTLFKLINLRFHSHFTCSWIWFQIPSTFRRHVNAMPMVRLLINKKQTTTVDFETYIILVNIEIQLAHHTSTLSRCDYFPNR